MRPGGEAPCLEAHVSGASAAQEQRRRHDSAGQMKQNQRLVKGERGPCLSLRCLVPVPGHVRACHSGPGTAGRDRAGGSLRQLLPLEVQSGSGPCSNKEERETTPTRQQLTIIHSLSLANSRPFPLYQRHFRHTKDEDQLAPILIALQVTARNGIASTLKERRSDVDVPSDSCLFFCDSERQEGFARLLSSPAASVDRPLTIKTKTRIQ